MMVESQLQLLECPSCLPQTYPQIRNDLDEVLSRKVGEYTSEDFFSCYWEIQPTRMAGAKFRVRSCLQFGFSPLPSHSQGIGDAIDVVEPGCDQGDLKDGLIYESFRAEAVVIFAADLRGVFCQLHNIFQH